MLSLILDFWGGMEMEKVMALSTKEVLREPRGRRVLGPLG